jgi:hypothetical protein
LICVFSILPCYDACNKWLVFLFCVLLQNKRSALRKKRAAWCCRSLGCGFEG